MNKPELVTQQFHKNIIDKNLGIDKSLVDSQKKLEMELKQLGVSTETTFDIEPALGFSRLSIYKSEN